MRVSKNWVKFNKMFTLSPWLFAYSTPTSPTVKPTSYNIMLNGGATLNGVFVANYAMDKLNGNYLVKYDESIMNTIKHGVEFKQLKLVPGSWRDW